MTLPEAVGVGLGFLAIVAPEFWPKMPRPLSFTLAAIGLGWLTYSLILGIEAGSGMKLAWGPLALIIVGAGAIGVGGLWHFARLHAAAKESAAPHESPTIAAPAADKREIVIRPPTHQYAFMWDLPVDPQMITRPRLNSGETEPLGTRLPVLWFKNLGKETPGEITIEWKIDLPGSPAEIFLASPRMKIVNPHVKDGMLCWEIEDPAPPKSLRGACTPVATEGQSKIDFPAPGRENDKFFPVAIPHAVWAAVESYVSASVHGMRGFPSITVPLSVRVTWTRPQPGESTAKFNCIFFKMGGETGPGAVQTYPPALRLEGGFNIEAAR